MVYKLNVKKENIIIIQLRSEFQTFENRKYSKSVSFEARNLNDHDHCIQPHSKTVCPDKGLPFEYRTCLVFTYLLQFVKNTTRFQFHTFCYPFRRPWQGEFDRSSDTQHHNANKMRLVVCMAGMSALPWSQPYIWSFLSSVLDGSDFQWSPNPQGTEVRFVVCLCIFGLVFETLLANLTTGSGFWTSFENWS